MDFQAPLFYHQRPAAATNKRYAELILIGIGVVFLGFSMFFQINANDGLRIGGAPCDTCYLNWDILEDYAAISGVIGVILVGIGAWRIITCHLASRKE